MSEKKYRHPAFASGGAPLLTTALEKKILKAVGTGLFLDQIAIIAGVHPQTLRLWIRKGEKMDAQDPYKSFAAKYYKEVTVKQEAPMVRVIMDAALGRRGQKTSREPDVKAAATYLTRRFAHRYGDKENTPVSRYDMELGPAINGNENLIDGFVNPSEELLRIIDASGHKLVPLTAEEKMSDGMEPENSDSPGVELTNPEIINIEIKKDKIS